MAKVHNSKREMILDAAYALFLNKGYLDTKIIDIADAAGIGKGTVYEYFESKDAIFYELFKTKVAAGYDTLSELLNKEIPCEIKIKEYLDIELTNTAKYTFNKNFLVDLMMKSDAFRNPELIESIHKLVSKKFAILYGIIDEGIKKGEFRNVDPMLATVSVMGAINFYISIDCFPVGPADFLPVQKTKDWDSEEFFSLLLHGLKP
ncbi:MAG TPA: TetR/AcrR family transcriptional regulator [Anaerovoracaceae bacterium]|nr:TetR/AcrR family transcriptional regulator [Anaerovoracaceae bacterium]